MSIRRDLSGNLSVRSGITDSLSVTRPSTDNLLVKSGLAVDLSVRRTLLTETLPVRRV